MADDILVSVCIITYNHEKFIAQALDSVLSQQCNFKFEVIVGEDCSKDNTREIVRSYAEKYPDLIVPLFPEKNQGPTRNASNIFDVMRGKYYAFLEGDDYWTDNNKLQRQVNFMEANPDFSLCYTNIDVVDYDGSATHGSFPVPLEDVSTIEDIILAERVFIPTATVMARCVLPKPMPQFFFAAHSGDIAVHLLLTDKGKAKFLPGVTAVYREHAGGITKAEKSIVEGEWLRLKLFIEANEYFNYKYDRLFRKRLSGMSKALLIYGSRNLKGLEKLKHLRRAAPYYFKYSDTRNAKEMIYYFTVLFLPFLLPKSKT